MTEEQKAVFDKAVEKLLGVSYEPVTYLGSQVVAGQNHCFLCKATVIYPDAKPTYARSCRQYFENCRIVNCGKDVGYKLTAEALMQMNVVMSGHRRDHDIRETFRIENEINQIRQRLKAENIQSVNDHEYDYAVGTLYVDMINELEKLGDYVVNVVEARFGR